jgi:hypothetical protein
MIVNEAQSAAHADVLRQGSTQRERPPAAFGVALHNVSDKARTQRISIEASVRNPLAIPINNKTKNQFTCGISQMQPDGSITPMCAFPLFGGREDVIAPIEQVLLMFSTQEVDTGAGIEQSCSAGLLVNLTGENACTVNFDINGGWSWDGGPWAQSVPANSNLVPLLAERSAALVSLAASMITSL